MQKNRAAIIEEIQRARGSRVITLIIADISRKAIDQVTSLVTELLEKRLPEEKAKKLTELIASGQFTHDFPITVERAKSVGLPVSIDMPGSIYMLMDFYPQQGIRRPSVNYVPLQKR